jgi:hypothetical protein
MVTTRFIQPHAWKAGAATRCVSRSRYGNPATTAIAASTPTGPRETPRGRPVVPDVRMTCRAVRPPDAGRPGGSGAPTSAAVSSRGTASGARPASSPSHTSAAMPSVATTSRTCSAVAPVLR